MTQAIKYKIHGIKCDHCAWKDMSVKFDDYKEWLNKPCPECGANLLTEADMKTCLFMIGMADKINEYIGEVKDDSKTVAIKIEMNGSGIPNIKIKDGDQ